MRILIVGAWAWPHYEAAFAKGLRACNVRVKRFVTSNYFRGVFGRTQEAIPIPGISCIRLNIAIKRTVARVAPDLVLFWRPTHILPQTLLYLADMGVMTASYNNDDPFGPRVHGNVPWHHHFMWYWYIKCLPVYDCNFFYRSINVIESQEFGAKNTHVLLPYFLPWKDRPMEMSESEHERYDSEVVFVGHYEPDGRENSIRALAKAGIRVKIWGGHYWNRTVLGDIYESISPIVPADGVEYAKALSGAKICLCFLSKMNRDTYTRRCFEIPACGKVMLAERTNDLLNFFKEDQEACFFSSNEELVRKVQWLLKNPDIRENIARSGMRRVWADGHDVFTRAKSFLSTVRSYKT
jgi:spore maturation protein CgeB